MGGTDDSAFTWLREEMRYTSYSIAPISYCLRWCNPPLQLM
ncbi:hypothetical protein SOVF_100010 [Spinacia oleracea]|nr:hypothetical protein SOVF_100010 [Spinacia oleracea]